MQNSRRSIGQYLVVIGNIGIGLYVIILLVRLVSTHVGPAWIVNFERSNELSLAIRTLATMSSIAVLPWLRKMESDSPTLVNLAKVICLLLAGQAALFFLAGAVPIGDIWLLSPPGRQIGFPSWQYLYIVGYFVVAAGFILIASSLQLSKTAEVHSSATSDIPLN